MNPENPHFEWILQIKSKSGFLRFIIRACFFFGKGSAKGSSDKRVFHANILVSPNFRSILRDNTFDREKENSGDYSVRIIEKFSSEVQNET